MTKEEALKYMESDFFEVYHDKNGKAWIHDYGYCYASDNGGYNKETKEENDPKYLYRWVDYCWLILDPEKLREQNSAYFDIKQCEVKQYMEDHDEKGIVKILKTELKKTKPLSMWKVTDDTPDGKYVDKMED